MKGSQSVEARLRYARRRKTIPQLFDRRIEQQLAVGRRYGPGPRRQFAFQLAAAPTGIPAEDAKAKCFVFFGLRDTIQASCIAGKDTRRQGTLLVWVGFL